MANIAWALPRDNNRPEDPKKKPTTEVKNNYTNDPNIIKAQEKGAASAVIGTPIIEDPSLPTPSHKTSEYEKQEAVDKFNAVLSAYPTYTEYYNTTKSHIPGMEQQGIKLLKQEKIKNEYKDVQNNFRTKEDFFIKNYGYEILADKGHDVRSSGYWYNKIMNNDTSNPLANSYTMSQVLAYAERQFELDFGSAAINALTPQKITLANELVGKEISAQEFNNLFHNQVSNAKKDITATEEMLKKAKIIGSLFQLDENGEIARDENGNPKDVPRLLYSDDGLPAYYLHTNNHLYRVLKEGESGGGPGDYAMTAKYNSKNELVALQDNNSFLTVGRSVFSGATSALYSMAELGGGLVGLIVDAGQWVVEAFDGEDETSGFDITSSIYGSLTSFKNSHTGWFDDGYVDLDSDSLSAMDLTTTVSSVLGSVAAMWGLGAIASGAATTGAKMVASATSTPLQQSLGKALTVGGQTVSRLTGLYSGSAGAGVQGKILSGGITDAAALARATARQHAQTVGTYMIKDFTEGVSHLAMRKEYDITFDMSNKDILLKSAKSAAIGGLISSVFAGGRDDSFYRRVQSWGAGLTNQGSGAVVNYISQNNLGVVFLDSFADLIDNYFTMALSQNLKQHGTISVSGNMELGISAILMAGVTGYGSYKNGIDTKGKVLRDTVPEVQRELALKVKDLRAKGKDAEAAAIIALLKEAEANRAKSLANKLDDNSVKHIYNISPDYTGKGGGTIGDNEIMGNEFLADLAYLETIKNNASTDLIEKTLSDVNIKAKTELFTLISDDVRKTFNTVRQAVADSGNDMSREGVAQVLYNKASKTFKRLNKKTKKLYVDMFTKAGGTETYHDVPFTVKDVEDLFNERYLSPGDVNPEVLDNIIKHKHLITDETDPDMYVELATRHGNDSVFQELTTGNTEGNLQTESVYAAKLLHAIAVADSDSSFSYEEINGRHFIITRGQKDYDISQLIALHNKVTGAIYAIKSDIDSEAIWDLAKLMTSADSELTTKNLDGSERKITARVKVPYIVKALSALEAMGVIDSRKSSILLRKFINDNPGINEDTLKAEVKQSPVYREYKFSKTLDETEEMLNSKEPNKQKVRAKLDSLLKYSDGESSVKEIYKSFAERDEYRDRVRTVLKLYGELQQTAPSQTHQIIDNFGKSFTYTATGSYKKAFKRAFGKALNSEPLLKTLEDSSYSKSTVVVDLSRFKTKAELDDTKAALTLGANNDVDAKYYENNPTATNKDLYNQQLAKERYMSNVPGLTSIVFDADSDEFESFYTSMGYEYASEVFAQGGVSKPVNKVFKIRITDNQAELIDSSTRKSRKTILTSKTNNLKIQAANNAKSEVHIDKDSRITINNLSTIISDDLEYDKNKEVSSSITFYELLKVAVTASKNKEKNFILKLTGKSFKGNLNKQKLDRIYLDNILDTLKGVTNPEIIIDDPELMEFYRNKKFEIYDYEDNADSLKLTLNMDKLNAKIEEINSEGVKDLELFQLVPLVPKSNLDNEGDINYRGLNMFRNPTTSTVENDIVSAFNNFISMKYGSILNINKLLRDLEGNKKITTSFINKPLELRDNMTIDELLDFIKKNKTSNNMFMDDLEKAETVLRFLMENSARDRTVNILVTDPEYRNIIIEGVINKLSATEIYDNIKDKHHDMSGTESHTPKQDHPVSITDDGYIGIGEVTYGLTVKNEVDFSNKEETIAKIDQAIKILTEGEKAPKEEVLTSLDRSVNNLKTFKKGNTLEIPIEEIIALSKDELELLKNIPSAKPLLDLRQKYLEAPGNFEQETLKEYLIDPESSSTVSVDERAVIANKKRKARIKTLEGNNNISKKLSDLVDKVSNETFVNILDNMVNKLDDANLMYKGLISTYDFTTKQGQDLFMNHLDHVFENVKQELIGKGITITEDVEDNILNTTIDILANSKGTIFANEYKNSFIMDDDGKVFMSSRTSRDEDDFNKMLASKPKEDLINKTMIVPDSESFDGVNPKLKSVKLDNDSVDRLKGAALMDLISNNIKIDPSMSTKDVEEAITKLFNMPTTTSDYYKVAQNILTDLGINESTVRALLKQPFKEEQANKFAGQSKLKSLSKTLNDAIEYGVGNIERESFRETVSTFKFKTEDYPNIDKKFKNNFKIAVDEYFREFYYVNNTRTVDVDITKLETLKNNLVEIYNNYKNEVSPIKDFDTKELQRFVNNSVMHSYLTKNDGAEVIKFMSDNKKFNRYNERTSKVERAVKIDTGVKYYTDSETVFGEVFKFSIYEVEYQDGVVVRKDVKSYYNRDVFENNNNRKTLIDKIINKSEYLSDAEIKELNLSRKFLEGNTGYKNALKELLTSTNMNKAEVEKILNDNAKDVVGFNTKGNKSQESDIDWLRNSGIISEEVANKLKQESLDLYNDAILEYGITFGTKDGTDTTQRKNLETVLDQAIREGYLGDDEDIKNLEDLHDSDTDVIATMYAHALVEKMVSSNETDPVRKAHKTNFIEATKDFDFINDSSFKYADDLSNEFRKVNKNLINYENSDMNIRKARAIVQAMQDHVKYKNINKKLSDKIYTMSVFSPDEIKAIRSNEYSTTIRHIAFVANLLSDDVELTEPVIKQAAQIVEQTLEKSLGITYKFNKDKLRRGILKSSNYGDSFYTQLLKNPTIRDAAIETYGTTDITPSELEEFVDQVNNTGNVTDVIKKLSPEYTNVNESILLQPLYNIRWELFTLGRDSLGIKNKSDLEDFINIMSTVATKDYNNLNDPNIGISYTENNYIDFVENTIREITKPEVSGIYLMAQPKLMSSPGTSSTEIEISSDLLKHTIDIDGENYLYLVRYPTVITGGKFYKVSVSDTEGTNYIGINPTMFKSSHQGDFDSDNVSVQEILESRIVNISEPQKDLLKLVYKINQEQFSEFDSIISKAEEYTSGYKGNESDKSRLTKAKVDAFTNKKLNEKVLKDIEEINNPKNTGTKRKELYEAKSKDKEYEVTYTDRHGEKIIINMFEEFIKPTTKDTLDSNYYKVFSISPVLPTDMSLRNINTRKALGLKATATYQTQLAGSWNKHRRGVHFESTTPLDEFVFTPITLANADIGILKDAINKAKDIDDVEYLGSLGITKDIDTDEAITTIERNLNHNVTKARTDNKELNKEFLDASTKAIESASNSEIYNILKEFKDLDLSPSEIDYFVTLKNSNDLNDIIVRHMIQHFSDVYGLDNIREYTYDRIGENHRMAVVDYRELGIQGVDEDTSFSLSDDKHSTIVNEHEVQIKKKDYKTLSYILSEEYKQKQLAKKTEARKEAEKEIKELQKLKSKTAPEVISILETSIKDLEDTLALKQTMVSTGLTSKGRVISSEALRDIEKDIYIISEKIDSSKDRLKNLRDSKPTTKDSDSKKAWIEKIDSDIEKLKNRDSFSKTYIQDINNNNVRLDPNGRVTIKQDNLTEIDGKYYLRYSTQESVSTTKFGGFKSVSSKDVPQEIKDKLNFLKEQGFDIVISTDNFNKKKHLEHDLDVETKVIGGHTVLEMNRPLFIVDYETAEAKNKNQTFNTNGLLQVSMNSPEAVLIYGDLLFSKEGDKLVANSYTIMDIVDKIKRSKKSPIYKEGNAFHKLHIVQALTLKNLLETLSPETAKESGIDTNFCLKNKAWGSQEGTANINWMKNMLVSKYKSEENMGIIFNDILIREGKEYLIPIFDNDKVTDKEIVSPLQIDRGGVTSKTTKDHDIMSGIIGAQNDTYNEDPNNRVSNKVTGSINHQDLFRLLGLYSSPYDVMNLSYKGYGQVQEVQQTGQSNNFEDIPTQLLQDSRISRVSGVTAENKGGSADINKGTYIESTDANRSSRPNLNNTADKFSLSYLNGPEYNTKLSDDINFMDSKSIELESGQTTLGTLHKLLGMKEKDLTSIFKTFGQDKYIDNVEYSRLGNEIIFNPETNKFEYKEVPLTDRDDYNSIQDKIKSRAYSPYFFREDSDLDLKLTDKDLADFRRGDNKDKVIDDVFKDIDTASFLPLTEREKLYYKELDRITVPESVIVDSEGKTRTAVFPINKSAIGTDNVKTNLFGAAGVDYTSESGFALNTLVPDAENASNRAIGVITTNIGKLNTLLDTKELRTEFNQYIKSKLILLEAKAGNEKLKEHITKIGFTNEESMRMFVSEFELLNPGVVSSYYNITKGLLEHKDIINKSVNEPFDSFLLLAPYIEASKDKRKERVRDTLNTAVTLEGDAEYMLLKNNAEDYLNSVKSLSGRIKSAYRATSFSKLLKMNGMISNGLAIDSTDLSTEEFEQLLKNIKLKDGYELSIDKIAETLNVISPTEPQFKQILRIGKEKYNMDSLLEIYTRLSNVIASDQFNNLSTDELQIKINNSKNASEIVQLEKLKDLKEVKAGIVYDTLKQTKGSVDTIYNKLINNGLKEFGEKATLVDMYGREIKYNVPFKALYEGSGEYIGRTLRFQGHDLEDFKRNVVAEAMKGNVYYGNKTVAEQLDRHIYIEKTFIGQKTLAKIGKKMQGLIMVNPVKFPDRVLSYSSFDIAQGIMVYPKSIMYMPRALRELKAFYQSNGGTMSDDLQAYYNSKGFSSKEASSRDVIVKDVEETDLSSRKFQPYKKVADFTKEGFDLQSDMYRYTLYLAMKDSFDKDEGYYGPTYKFKDRIDSIKDQSQEEANLLGYARPLTASEKKAYQVVSYTYGNPGTFPILAKKLNGLLVFSTFPFAFMRSTEGFVSGAIKGLELATRENDPRGIFKNTIVPGLGLVGVTLLYNLFVDGVSELYGIEDEDKEKIKEDQRSFAPIGTLLLDTPVFNYDTFNPYNILKEMTLEPILKTMDDSYNDGYGGSKLEEAILRFVNTNAISRLNPAVKSAVEIATQKDLIGSYITDTKYEYTFMENLFRKLLSFPAGSAGSKAIVDAFALQKYTGNTNGKALINGATRAVLDELGNTKGYKRLKSNYYKARQSLNTQKIIENGLKYPEYEDEDLFNESISTYSSDYNKEDAMRLTKKIDKAIKRESPPSVIHNIILEAINKEYVSTDTVNSVLNKISTTRKLNSLKDSNEYINSLSDLQKSQLQDALRYEELYFPTLKDIKFNNKYDNDSLPYISNHYTRKPYTNVSAPYHPKSYYKSPYYNINNRTHKIPDVTKTSSQMGVWDKKKT